MSGWLSRLSLFSIGSHLSGQNVQIIVRIDKRHGT
jgi:hypothetical protein